MRNKKRIGLVAVALILFGVIWSWFGGRWSTLREIKEKTGLDLPGNKNYGYVDTHGGFFGDGHTLATLTFSEKADTKLRQQMESLPYWRKMPLTEYVDIFLYGGYLDGWYRCGGSLEEGFPQVTEGYWFLLDEASDVTGDGDKPGEAHNDANLFKRASFNVTVVVYDTENRTLYYYELDT